MFSFLVQTLFALQGSMKRNRSNSPHLHGVCLPSPTFINVKTHDRDALFASPRQQSEIIDESEPLDWLQKRLGLHDAQSNALAKRFPKVHTLSIEEQLAPTLDWLQARIGLSDEELGELVRRQPTILNSSVQDDLAPNISWLQDRLQLDSESLPWTVLRLTPVCGLTQLLGSNMQDNLEPTLVWLQEKLNLDDAGLRKVVEKYPSLLGLCVDDNLEPKIAWLKARLC
jgi:hypothetical protein